MENIRKRYFGDKDFYKKIFGIALPIMIQNGFTNFINLIDNLMVGQIGTDQMSGVAIVNQLLFIFNLSIFGGLAGAGIYLAQFYGSGDRKNMKNVFRMKIIIAAILTIVGLLIMYLGQDTLISLFLHDGSATGNLEATLMYAKQYIVIMLIGLVPFSITQCYASSMRETGETLHPMKAGIVAVIANLCFNYVLIYGKLGMPALGVRGAAIATVISRFIECIIVVAWTLNKEKYDFMQKIFYKFSIPADILKNVIQKGFPLLLNEFLWSSAMTMLTLCYSTRGLAAVAGINICNTINNVFNIGFIAMGNAVAIIVGQLLGAERFEEAKDAARKLMVFTVLFCSVVAVFMAALAPFFPYLYNTTSEVRELATYFIFIMAALMPFCAFTNAAYFTLRSGGRTGITFVFDSCYAWGICVTISCFLAYCTNVSVVWMYLICQSLEIIKCFIGYVLVKKGIWIQNLSKN